MRHLTGENTASALFLILIALSILWFGRDLSIGSLTFMGPAYIPFLLAGCLLVLGALIAIRSMGNAGEQIGSIAWRPVIAISAAILAFAFLLERTGLLPAATSAVFLSALATPQYRLYEVLALSVGMAVFSAVLFVGLLGVPVSVWAWP